MYSEIVEIDFEEALKYRKNAIKEQVSFHNNTNCKWFGIYDADKLISFYCLMINNKSARFKSNYTLNEYRRQGCLNRFIQHAKNYCKENNIHIITLFCTKMSVNSHCKNGMEIIRFNDKNNIYYGRYMI